MNELIYLYAIVPKEEKFNKDFPKLTSFDGKGTVETLSINDNLAIICRLDSKEYSENIIENKIENDMEWLQEKAFHHHEIIEQLYKKYTIIPLKFCTIYQNETSLKESIQEVQLKLSETFKYIYNKDEWALKIYGDDAKIKEDIDQNNEIIASKRKEISNLPRGKRFFEEKKIESILEEELEKEKQLVGEKLQQQLRNIAVDYSIKKNWSKDVTGLKEDMIWNSVYLIPKNKIEDFKNIISNQKQTIQGNGWRLEVTGPWPAYHFATLN